MSALERLSRLINDVLTYLDMLKRIWPRTDPWGMPQARGWRGDVKPEARTVKERDDK